ncbi:hypothetical protein FRB95_014718 [Tulasnella sp. JGI-2019a]|nr:hypothetical protein FRB95_014718 [Tulasnella sp. JGI-2019a]
MRGVAVAVDSPDRNFQPTMLISDPDYLIHTLRLTYLRSIDDPFGARIITLNPQYASNPYVRAAGLADVDTWPELNVPSSPRPAADDAFDPHSFHGFNNTDLTSQNGRNRHLPPSGEASGVYPGAVGLKHTQTIVGPGRVLGAGMRVSGRRSSTTRAPGSSVAASIDSNLQRIRSDSAPTPVSSQRPPKIAVESPNTLVETSNLNPSKRRGSGGSHVPSVGEASTPESRSKVGFSSPVPPSSNVPPVSHTEGQDPVRPPLPAFALRLAQGGEMEERRRARMRARFDGAAARAGAPVEGALPHAAPQMPRDPPGVIDSSDEEDGAVPNPERNSDSSDAAHGDESEDDTSSSEGDILADEGGGTVEDDDDFLGSGFPMPPSMNSNNTVSDDTSMLSSGISASHSSPFGSSLLIAQSMRQRHKLSPVSEGLGERKDVSDSPDEVASTTGDMGQSDQPSRPPTGRQVDKSHFSISPPEPVNPGVSGAPLTFSTATSSIGPITTLHSTMNPDNLRTPVTPRDRDVPSPSRSEVSIFAKRPIVPPVFRSALSARLSAPDAMSNNPFNELYAAISGRAETSSMTISVFFPHSPAAAVKAVEMKVRKDATVEEVIGFSLWTYWSKDLEPKLDAGLGGEDDPKRDIVLSAVGWNLRIAEDDGEVDEDFPALDRTRPISKFSFDSFALCAANPTQVEQNRVVESKIVRRPSRLMIAKKATGRSERSNTGGLVPPAVSGGGVAASARTTSDALTSAPFLPVSHTSGATMASGPPVYLRVRVATTADMHYSTTINGTSEEYMADVLDRVCRRRRLENPKEWALLTSDMRIVIPLDRTVASLAGKTELVLVKNALLDQLGLSKDKRLGRTSDPNASIFKRLSEVPAGNAALDFTAAYKRFTVYRKLPMMVGRHERYLAIDGDDIHIMPATSRGLLDSVKTSSYHIKSVVYCKQSKKSTNSPNVKLIVWRDGGNKTYDLEAEDGKKAAEIVATIKNLQKAYAAEKSGAVKHVGRVRSSSRAVLPPTGPIR